MENRSTCHECGQLEGSEEESDKWYQFLRLVLPLAEVGAMHAHPSVRDECFEKVRRAYREINRQPDDIPR